MWQIEIPSELRRLLEAAEEHNAAAVIYDEKDNTILTNSRYREIYYFVDFEKPQTYNSTMWKCIEMELLDDPVFYNEPEAWINRVNQFRKKYSLAQYLITHVKRGKADDGKTYWAHHQRFEGVGTLAVRFDVNDKFYFRSSGGTSSLTASDPIGAQWFSSALSRKTELASAIVSRNAKIIDANEEFVKVVSRNDGIGLKNDKIWISSSSDNTKFNKMITEKASANPQHQPSVIKVESLSSEKYYIVSVAPLLTSSFCFNQTMHGVALVSVVDPYWEPPIDIQMLKNVFDLTIAEARVAASIGTGKDLSEIARENGVSIGTVRNQLKTVFQKTGVNRQSEVVRLVHRMSVLGVKTSIE